MLDEDKLALEQNTAAIRCKIIVKATDTLPEIVLTEDNSIKDWVYTDERYVPQQGFIGQFVARTLEGNLQNIADDFNIENREIELMVGIVKLGSRFTYITTEDGLRLLTENGDYIIFNDLGEDQTNWYSFGNFLITNPEDDEVADNTKFEAMDYTKLFNKSFDYDYHDDNFTESYNTKITNGESITALWLAQYTCAQVGVEFGQEYFTNSDFEISDNYFQAGETCRDVMKEIAKLAFSWVRIDWDNKCYIDFGEGISLYSDNSYNIIDNNQYFTLETKKEVYGPINRVYVGMSGVDGETLLVAEDTASVEENGEHAIYIYDNPLIYTPELREMIKDNASATKLLGLTYTQLTAETIGHPWLKGNEVIEVLNMEDEVCSTYAFNRTLTYSGHIRSVLDSMGDSEIEETLSYESNIIKDLVNAKLTVNKATGDITALSERTQVLEGLSGEYYTKEQVEQLIINATEGLTNTYTSAGGNNKFRNTGLYFEEGTGFEYWEGTVERITEDDSATQTAMLLQNGSVKQSVIGLPNKDYTISFKYEKLQELAIASVIINTVVYELGEQGNFAETIQVNTNSLEIEFVCDVTGGYEIYELMCNVGTEALVWSQHPDEIATDTVNISKGITITSTSQGATFKANADGIRIINNNDNETTVFTNTGMITNEATVKGNANITEVSFKKVGNQTWLTGE